MHQVAPEAAPEPVTELRPATRVKLTAERLALVESLQASLRTCAGQAAELAELEENGWVSGTPQTQRSHRVDPLAALADQLVQAVEQLEGLYS